VIDLDREILDRVLPAPSGSPDWSDVMSRADEHRGRRRRRLVALAAAALIVVGAASGFAAVRDLIFGKDPTIVGIELKGTWVRGSLPDASGRRIVARGRFALWIAATPTREFSDRGRFVDYEYPPPSSKKYLRSKYVRVLHGAKGTIEVLYPPVTYPLPPPRAVPNWRVTNGTGDYAGLRGFGRDWGAYRPPTPVYVVMSGEFRQ